jgi:hypothetical protein
MKTAQRDRRLGLVTLILKRATASRSSGEWSEDDYDVLAGAVVGRILNVHAAPTERPQPCSVRPICRYGRTGTDRKQPKPKIARRNQKTYP